MQTPQGVVPAEFAANSTANAFSGTDKLHLFKSTFTPVANSTLADFQANEVAFTGYAPFVMAGGFNFGLDDGGNVIAYSSDLATFAQSGVVAVDVAGGWWMDDGASPPVQLEGWGLLDSPFEFNKSGNTLQAVIRIGFPTFADATVATTVGP